MGDMDFEIFSARCEFTKTVIVQMDMQQLNLSSACCAIMATAPSAELQGNEEIAARMPVFDTCKDG